MNQYASADGIGPTMRRILDFVADNPGCTKLAAVDACTATRSNGYRAIDRCIARGLLRARPESGRYALVSQVATIIDPDDEP